MIDPILMAVTIVSLGIAAAMGVITWRALHQDGGRDEAGSAALSVPDRERPSQRSGVRQGSPIQEARPVAAHGRRVLVAAAIVGVLVMAAAIGTAIAVTPDVAVRGTESPAAARVASPIELVSLNHARTGEQLSIHGLVRNPVTGRAIRNLIAVVFLFDRAGAYVGTQQAAVAGDELAPGHQTSFEIPVASGQQVARYRLSFRVAAAPVPHIDRRVTTRPQASEPTHEAAGTPLAFGAATFAKLP